MYVYVYCVFQRMYLLNASVQIIGRSYDRDDITEDEGEVFESIYSMLTAISPGYLNTFSEAVASKLNQLANSTDT